MIQYRQAFFQLFFYCYFSANHSGRFTFYNRQKSSINWKCFKNAFTYLLRHGVDVTQGKIFKQSKVGFEFSFLSLRLVSQFAITERSERDWFIPFSFLSVNVHARVLLCMYVMFECVCVCVCEYYCLSVFECACMYVSFVGLSKCMYMVNRIFRWLYICVRMYTSLCVFTCVYVCVCVGVRICGHLRVQVYIYSTFLLLTGYHTRLTFKRSYYFSLIGWSKKNLWVQPALLFTHRHEKEEKGSYFFSRALARSEMQTSSGFALRSPIPFPLTITVIQNIIWKLLFYIYPQ